MATRARPSHVPILICLIAISLASTPGGNPLAAPVGKDAETAAESGWQSLQPGLDLGVFPSPQPSVTGDSLIRVLRIDPRRYELRLLNASAHPDHGPLTAKEWCRRHDLIAAINASMYQTDHQTSVALMRSRTHVNNPVVSKDKAVLAFERLSPDVPPVRILDLQFDKLDAWRAKYGTLIQNIRMISRKRENMWAEQPRRWSEASIGIDSQGRVLFIHVRSPYTMHELIDILLGLPIRIAGAMHVEGGPEAQLYLRSGSREEELVGQYETGFVEEEDANPFVVPVPNVVGVVEREKLAE